MAAEPLGGGGAVSRAAQEATRKSLRREAAAAPRSRSNLVQLCLVYELPLPCGDEANERRRTHADLAGMSDWEVEAEADRARLALCFGSFANIWQREWTARRLGACQEEMIGRRSRRR